MMTSLARSPARSMVAAVALASMAAAPHATAQTEAVSLAGTWRLAPDPDASGTDSIRKLGLTQTADVWLPGSLQAQGHGDLPRMDSPWVGDTRPAEWARDEYAPYRSDDNFKMPFWLTPDRVFVGAAWYSREVTVPPTWTGKHVTLYLERAHWVTEAWLDGRPIGKGESLSTPHHFDIGAIEPGTYTLDLRIDNSMAYGVGPNAHSMTDHTQTNWNGVVGAIQLRAVPMVSVEQVRVVPRGSTKSAVATVTVRNRTSADTTVDLSAVATNDYAPAASANSTLTVPANSDAQAEIRVDLGPDAAMWSEFTPHAYHLAVTADSTSGSHTFETWFGLRDLASDDGRFTINGNPIYLRGTLECAIFPKTGYPPTDTAEWERIFNRLREFGLNHMRFHSWCPPRAAFLAADKLGMYLQVEGPFWVNQGPQLGLGDPIDQYVYEETDRILAEFGNHPSFLLMAYGNEPNGPGPRGLGENFLGEWLNTYKVADNRRFYTSGAGWPIMEESQFHVPYQPRIQRWGEGLDSTINSKPPTTRTDYNEYSARFDDPILAHEIGQWCVFPNFEEMGKYTGHLKPKNFEIFRDLLTNSGLGHRERDFLMASGRLQVLAYKEEIEAALRTSDFGGFQLLDLHDFPGQGTALVGVLDPFWDPKPYITADEFHSFSGPITPLARFADRVFTNGEEFAADIDIAQFGAAALDDAVVAWSITLKDGTTMAAGDFAAMDLPVGDLIRVGSLRTTLSAELATKATLRVEIEGEIQGENIANTWDIWIFPNESAAPMPSDVHFTRVLDAEAERVLARGGTVLFMPEGRFTTGDVALGFSPVFWNTAWTNGQAPHTLGLFIEPNHPLFNHFPTDYHTDWQWWDLIGWPSAQAGAMVLTDLPLELDPLVQPIDTWFRSRKLASLFETRVGEGRLMVSALDIDTDLDERHAARQFRKSLLAYMTSSEFAPSIAVTADQVRSLFREPPTAERLRARVSDATRNHPGYPATNVLDGDPSSLWHTRWSGDIPQHPHSITIELPEPARLAGMTYLSRQDRNLNGQIDRYTVEVSTDGEAWTRVANGRFVANGPAQPVEFDRPRSVTHIRLTAETSHGSRPYSAVAEIDLLTE